MPSALVRVMPVSYHLRPGETDAAAIGALMAERLGDEVGELVIDYMPVQRLESAAPEAETNDKDYIFMTYVMNNLPVGMIGLLFAVMFSAAMSSTSSELNALASTSTIDLYKRSIKKEASDKHYLEEANIPAVAHGRHSQIRGTSKWCSVKEYENE